VLAPTGVLAPIAARLGGDEIVTDDEFDAVYPTWVRRRSWVHWTPVAVARRAAAWLAPSPGARVLDVGAGVGKFCTIAALCRGARVVGVEQHADFVDVARQVAKHYGVGEQVELVAGDMSAVIWAEFDGLYLYNPFADGPEDGRPMRATAQVRFALDQLAAARLGTRVATYHGLGADLPPSYRQVAEAAGTANDDEALHFWVKAA
jgi:predicted RNA methylase